jgi:hypothetical protein
MLCEALLQINSRACDRKRIAKLPPMKIGGVPLDSYWVREGRSKAMTRKSGDLPSVSFVRLARTSKEAGVYLRSSDQQDVGHNL